VAVVHSYSCDYGVVVKDFVEEGAREHWEVATGDWNCGPPAYVRLNPCPVRKLLVSLTTTNLRVT
jgi:hypothetical protein